MGHFPSLRKFISRLSLPGLAASLYLPRCSNPRCAALGYAAPVGISWSTGAGCKRTAPWPSVPLPAPPTCTEKCRSALCVKRQYIVYQNAGFVERRGTHISIICERGEKSDPTPPSFSTCAFLSTSSSRHPAVSRDSREAWAWVCVGRPESAPFSRRSAK